MRSPEDTSTDHHRSSAELGAVQLTDKELASSVRGAHAGSSGRLRVETHHRLLRPSFGPEKAVRSVPSAGSSHSRVEHSARALAPSPFDFLNQLEPEEKVILYPKTNERARFSLHKVGSRWEYSLERISKDRISKELPDLASETTFAEYQRKRLVECRGEGKAR